MKPEILKSWKVRSTTTGAILTINGKEYDLGPSASAIAFDLSRAADGCNAPETEQKALR